MRVTKSRKLVGFISAIPASVRVNDKVRLLGIQIVSLITVYLN